MIRSVIKIGLLLLVGILFYNYFFGTPEEKEQSARIVGKAVDFGRDAWGLLRSEKEKFDEGKYDEAVDKIGNLYASIRQTAEKVNDSGALERLAELEERRSELERELESDRPQSYDETEKRRLQREWQDLMSDTEDLMEEMERNSPPQ